MEESRWPLNQEVLDSQGHTLRIQGATLYRLAVRHVHEAVMQHLEEEKMGSQPISAGDFFTRLTVEC